MSMRFTIGISIAAIAAFAFALPAWSHHSHGNYNDTFMDLEGVVKEIHFAAGATEVYPNIGRIGVLKFDQLADFEATAIKPSELRLEAFHPMGSARIAADPANGVCSPDGAVNGVDDLYVADGSLFPTSVGVNPMMTIIAFSKRIAAGLAERL